MEENSVKDEVVVACCFYFCRRSCAWVVVFMMYSEHIRRGTLEMKLLARFRLLFRRRLLCAWIVVFWRYGALAICVEK